MADLTFADSHNMVAYLEKSEDNADFAKIVDFLNASPIRRDLHFNDEDGITCLTNTDIFENLQLMGSKSTALNEFGTNIASAVICLTKKQKFNFSKLILDAVFNDEYDTPSHTKKVFENMRRQGKDFSGTMTPLFATMLIQSQAVEGEGLGQPTESQHTPTTASPSHVKPIPIALPNVLFPGELVQGAYSPQEEQPGSDEERIKLKELMDMYTKLSDRVLDLENVKDAQALEIKRLKKRVKKLEKKKKLRTPQLKRRSFKVMIESSAEKSFGDQEDASKQGRNEIDQDEEILWFQEDLETQGMYGHDIGVNTASTSITTASINITIAEPVTTAIVPITTTGVSVSTAEPSTPPLPTTTTTTTHIKDEDLTVAQILMKMESEKSKAKGVTMQNPSESGTRVRGPPPQIDPKDKGKAKMLDEEVRLEKEREVEASKAANIAKWDDVQAMMDADYELAAKLQAEEQGEISIKERSKLFVELLNERKKHFARLGTEEQRRKPLTKAQKRKKLINYTN
ncbi:hypothetical protein Tco_0231064 [Tanacetum coccineum]